MKRFQKNGRNTMQIGNYRVGIDSDRHVRYPIQNILAHGWISPQPGFQVLSKGVKPYFQYQTYNQFTSW